MEWRFVSWLHISFYNVVSLNITISGQLPPEENYPPGYGLGLGQGQG